MRTLTLLVVAGALAAACAMQPDPPPSIPPSAYGGMGAEMAKCMQYASESYCYRQIMGGGRQ